MVGKQYKPKLDYDNIIEDYARGAISDTELGEIKAKFAKRINVRAKAFEDAGMTNTAGYKAIMHYIQANEGKNKTRFSQSKKFTPKTLDEITSMIEILSGENTSVGQQHEENRQLIETAENVGIHISNETELNNFRDFFKSQEWRTMCGLMGYDGAKDAVMRNMQREKGLDTRNMAADFADYCNNAGIDLEERRDYIDELQENPFIEDEKKKKKKEQKSAAADYKRENDNKKGRVRVSKETRELWNNIFN